MSSLGFQFSFLFALIRVHSRPFAVTFLNGAEFFKGFLNESGVLDLG